MRIAVFHDLPSGGAKRTLHELVKRLVRRHQIDLYSLSTADERFADVRPFAAVRHVASFAPRRLFPSPLGRLNQAQRWLDLQRLTRLGRDLAARIDAGGYDVLLAEPSMWTQAPPLLLFTSTPALYDLHEPPRALYEPRLRDSDGPRWRRALDRIDPLIALYRGAARRLDRDATRAAPRIAVNSRFIQRAVRRIYGVEALVLYHGVDVEHFRPRSDLARRLEVLSVGAVQPSKGFACLIESLAEIPAAVRPPLRLIGNAEAPGERARLARLAAARGVALHIERGVSDALLAQRYAEAALFAYAPHDEPFGLAALEAMSCATPVVGVAEGGVTESVVDGVTGRLAGRDPRQLAATIQALLADPAERRRLGDNGRAAVEREWTWDRRAAPVDDALAELAAHGGGCAPVARAPAGAR
jgi:glycosyltransferase involved in cell wall biosynthesis